MGASRTHRLFAMRALRKCVKIDDFRRFHTFFIGSREKIASAHRFSGSHPPKPIGFSSFGRPTHRNPIGWSTPDARTHAPHAPQKLAKLSDAEHLLEYAEDANDLHKVLRDAVTHARVRSLICGHSCTRAVTHARVRSLMRACGHSCMHACRCSAVRSAQRSARTSCTQCWGRRCRWG
jgi:hypothetical protein